METAEAVIIGGGLIGTSIAYHLSKTMKKVVLVEKGEIGGQTSGSCDKAIFLQSKKPGFPITLAKASRALYNGLEEELGYPFEFKQSGGMIVIESNSHIPFMKEFVRKQQTAGIDVRLLDQKEALEMQPCLSPHILGATFSSEDAEVNPLLLTQAFAYGAKRNNADIRTHTEVIDVLHDERKVVGVETTKGKIATDFVINAAGPFANEIAEMVKMNISIQPRRGVILITEKTKPMINGSMLCSQYIASKHLTEAAGEIIPPYGIGLSLGQTDSGNVLIGGTREFVDFNKKITVEILGEIAAHAIRIVPTLEKTRIIRYMVGFRPFTGDGLPIIDESPYLKGFITAAGHEGDGIALAPITGKLVASLVKGKKDPLLKSLKADRFMNAFQ